MTRAIARALTMLWLTGSAASGQKSSFARGIESGVTFAFGRQVLNDGSHEWTFPKAVRVAYTSPESSWGAEFSVEFGGERTVNGRKYWEHGVPISVFRRIGPAWGEDRRSANIVSLGYSRLAVAPHRDSSGTLFRGLLYGFGQRLAVGNGMMIRHDYSALSDRGRTQSGSSNAGVLRNSLRIGVSGFPYAMY